MLLFAASDIARCCIDLRADGMVATHTRLCIKILALLLTVDVLMLRRWCCVSLAQMAVVFSSFRL